MKRLLIILILLSGLVSAADYDFGPSVQLGDGITVSLSQVYMVPATSDGAAGTLDSIVFYAKSGGATDTVYGCVYTVSGSDPNQLVAVSTDSVEVDQNISLAHYVVTFSSGSIEASTEYFIGVAIRSSTSGCQFEAHDDDGSPANNAVAQYTDVWPLETTAPFAATTGYAPFVTAWYSSASGTSSKITAKTTLGKGTF